MTEQKVLKGKEKESESVEVAEEWPLETAIGPVAMLLETQLVAELEQNEARLVVELVQNEAQLVA